MDSLSSSSSSYYQSRRIPSRRLRNLPPPKPDFSFARCPEPSYYVKDGCEITVARRMKLFWWRKRILIESTFALTVYEPWEKVVVLTLFTFLTLAIFVVLLKFLPRQLLVMRRRSIYYLWGSEEFGVATTLNGLGAGIGEQNVSMTVERAKTYLGFNGLAMMGKGD